MTNGSGPIIINNLIETPGVTAAERSELQRILKRYEPEHQCSIADAWYVIRVTWRLIR